MTVLLRELFLWPQRGGRNLPGTRNLKASADEVKLYRLMVEERAGSGC